MVHLPSFAAFAFLLLKRFELMTMQVVCRRPLTHPSSGLTHSGKSSSALTSRVRITKLDTSSSTFQIGLARQTPMPIMSRR